MKKQSIIWGILTSLVIWFILFPATLMEKGIYQQWIAPSIFMLVSLITIYVWIKNEIINNSNKINVT